MSKQDVASVYTMMLNAEPFRDEVAQDPGVLAAWDLSDEERQVLIDEATTEVSGFALGSGPVMSWLSGPSGAPLTGPVAASLGVALNKASGLPTGALNGPGFTSGAGCCPWNGGFIGRGAAVE